jgi:hypothetical protein
LYRQFVLKRRKMVSIGFLEKSAAKYQSALRNDPEERISHLHSGKSLKSP